MPAISFHYLLLVGAVIVVAAFAIRAIRRHFGHLPGTQQQSPELLKPEPAEPELSIEAATREILFLWGQSARDSNDADWLNSRGDDSANFAPNLDAEYLDGPHFSLDTTRASQPWALSLTSDFRKAVACVDKKMQGRVLEALSELSVNPNTAIGDTVRPLVGDRKGLWRYRLGDFRLIYEPLTKIHVVKLVDFAPRGQVYE